MCTKTNTIGSSRMETIVIINADAALSGLVRPEEHEPFFGRLYECPHTNVLDRDAIMRLHIEEVTKQFSPCIAKRNAGLVDGHQSVLLILKCECCPNETL